MQQLSGPRIVGPAYMAVPCVIPRGVISGLSVASAVMQKQLHKYLKQRGGVCRVYAANSCSLEIHGIAKVCEK